MTFAVVARRELAGFFYAPIAYVVGVVFLAIQGFSFWAVVRVLSDPRQPAESGAVLETHFGGTFLFWALLAAVVAMVAMRAVAEDRQSGIFEVTLTAPVSLESVLIGKWLGALGFYALLWAPTLVYLPVLAAFSPPGSAVDLGPVLSAYVGVLAIGAGFLALGVAASAATANQIIAGVVAFALCLGALLVGELESLAPDALASQPALAAVIAAVDVRAHMGSFARGAIELSACVFSLSLVAVGLAIAAVTGAAGRVRRRQLGWRALAAALVALIAILSMGLAARHPATFDTTASRLYTLEPATERALAAIERPVEVVIVRPAAEVFDPVYEQVGRLLERMQRRQPRLELRRVDPRLEPDRIEALARDLGLAPRDVAEGGAVVFESDGRTRAIDLLDMAGFDRDTLGVGALSTFRAEEAFTEALSELSDRAPALVCATTGHGELPLAGKGDPSWRAIGDRLRRDGIGVEELASVTGGVPERCDALVVAGPSRPLPADAALAIDRYLGAGGALVVAARGEDGAAATGLELVLAERGVALGRDRVEDSAASVGVPGAFAVVSGYGSHPISARFDERRVTVWQSPRRLGVTGDGAEALVTSSKGEVVAAVASGDRGRVVVFGSAESLSSSMIDRGLGAGDVLATRSLLWLVGRERDVEIGDKTPEHVRLIMTEGELRATFVLCAVAVPAVFALLGALLWWWRRRE